MSTYNGQKYIKKQIDSILNQTFSDFLLYIRDDGSTDNTVNIIKEYKDERICLICAENVGPAESFFDLLRQVDDCEYIFFCDQDDEWYPDKIELMLREIEKYDEPTMVFSDFTMIDENSAVTSESYEKHCGLQIEKGDKILPKILAQPYVFGCAAVINRKLAEMVKYPPAGIEMHDCWISLTAASVGNLIYMPIQTIMHRFHSSNATGRADSDSFVARFRRMTVEMKNVSKNSYLRLNQAKLLLETHGELIKPQQRKLLEDICNAKMQGRISLIMALVRNHVSRQRTLNTLFFYSSVLLYKGDC
ncbi:MAG: glycosyltransferase family 2 protein [Clostridia bacterium]|nr:glycosyltransferase family 2 protein [Clostridia bacterium]